MSKNFALLGAAGYIAPRHMRAIQENNCNIVAAIDPFDSVGIIDSYFPDAYFFTEIERFDRFIDKIKNTDSKVDYFSVCSPNYLHDAHIRLALRNRCDVICEKPLVINPDNLKYLQKLEKEYNKKVYAILQLRHHPKIVSLKESIGNKKDNFVKLDYITSRGKWYLSSWKGDDKKSGGLAANIGIHFFDMLIWIFGDVVSNEIDIKTEDTITGLLKLDRATVDWKLSIDSTKLPESAVLLNSRAYRNISINGKPLEFTKGFTDLHTISYKNILKGNGFGIEDTVKSLEVVNKILKHKG